MYPTGISARNTNVVHKSNKAFLRMCVETLIGPIASLPPVCFGLIPAAYIVITIQVIADNFARYAKNGGSA